MDSQLYKELTHYLNTLTHLDGLSNQRKTHIRRISTQYFVFNHLLFRKTKDGNRRVILQEQVEPILFHLHTDMNGAHLGVDAVVGKIKERYYWPQMGEDVKNYIQTCDVCQRRGPPQRREELIPIKVKGPFYRIGIDIKVGIGIDSTKIKSIENQIRINLIDYQIF